MESASWGEWKRLGMWALAMWLFGLCPKRPSPHSCVACDIWCWPSLSRQFFEKTESMSRWCKKACMCHVPVFCYRIPIAGWHSPNLSVVCFTFPPKKKNKTLTNSAHDSTKCCSHVQRETLQLQNFGRAIGSFSHWFSRCFEDLLVSEFMMIPSVNYTWSYLKRL